MPITHYYGKKTDLVGKTLYEILSNLRNFGIGRVIIKQSEKLRNPGAKSYYIVKKVEPVMDSKLECGAIWAERIFNNAKVPGLVYIEQESWHTDWQLVPKNLESKYTIDQANLIEHGHPSTVKVLPKYMKIPPLMDIFLRRHYAARNNQTLAEVKNLDSQNDPLVIKMFYDLERMNKPHSIHRLAEDGEEAHERYEVPLQEALSEQFRYKNTIKKEQTN